MFAQLLCAGLPAGKLRNRDSRQARVCPTSTAATRPRLLTIRPATVGTDVNLLHELSLEYYAIKFTLRVSNNPAT